MLIIVHLVVPPDANKHNTHWHTTCSSSTNAWCWSQIFWTEEIIDNLSIGNLLLIPYTTIYNIVPLVPNGTLGHQRTIAVLPQSDFGHETPKPDIFGHWSIKASNFGPDWFQNSKEVLAYIYVFFLKII